MPQSGRILLLGISWLSNGDRELSKGPPSVSPLKVDREKYSRVWASYLSKTVTIKSNVKDGVESAALAKTLVTNQIN